MQWLNARAVWLALALVAALAAAGVTQPAAGVRLTVELTDEPDPVLLGENVQWTLTVRNDDARQLTAHGVVVQDVLPAEAALQAAETSAGTCALGDGAFSCALGDLAPGARAEVRVRAAVVALPADGRLVNAVAVTSFAPQATRADAAVAAQETAVLAAWPEPEPPPPTVEPKTIAVSPTCVLPSGNLTLFGQGFDVLGLAFGDVRVGDLPARILAYSETGLVVEVPPALAEGPTTVVVRGAANAPVVRVSAQCNPELFTREDTETGFISGNVLIFFNEELSDEALEAFRQEYGLKTLIHHSLLGYTFAQLGDPPEVQEAETAPVTCAVNKRSSAPPLDLVLLVDQSGTMSGAKLRPLFAELANQMYCLLNRETRIAVLGYNETVHTALELAPWTTQHAALRDWLETPLVAEKGSNLEGALHEALEYLSAQGAPGGQRQVMVFTRGPAQPRIRDPQGLVAHAREAGVVVHGVALTSRLFRGSAYDALREVARGTGRDVLLFDERDAESAAFATCSIVYGVYGAECDANTQAPAALPASETVTCAIVSGIYGIPDCTREGLSKIPSVGPSYTEAVIEALNRDPRVDEAFFNDLQNNAQTSPDDPDIPQQHWLLQLGLPQGWDTYFPRRGAGAILAVIDTGVDLTLTGGEDAEVHLDPAAPQGLNFAPIPPEIEDHTGNDEVGHGTAVSSIAASMVGNAFNGGGVAPEATVIALKVFAVVGGQVKASNDSVAQALMNAFVLGVDVVNMSLGCEGCDDAREQRLRKFYSRVIDNLMAQQRAAGAQVPILVAASGNDGVRFLDAPAFHPEVIAVGSVNASLTARSTFSSYGPELDFVAPGENPSTTLAGGAFSSPGSGTSFAAPQVAGLVALLRAERPALTLEEVIETIKACFVVDLDPPGFDEETGWGRIFLPAPADATPGCLPG